MYAIVEIAGQQFKVEKDQKVFVHRLATEEGKTVSFDKVLLIGDGDSITLGAPAIDGALIGAKVLSHLKGDKVIVFKKKRRKGYRVKNGHRQSLTEIVIESFDFPGSQKTEKSEKSKPVKEEKAENVAPEAKAKKAEPKKAAKKKDEVSEDSVTPAAQKSDDTSNEIKSAE